MSWPIEIVCALWVAWTATTPIAAMPRSASMLNKRRVERGAVRIGHAYGYVAQTSHFLFKEPERRTAQRHARQAADRSSNVDPDVIESAASAVLPTRGRPPLRPPMREAPASPIEDTHAATGMTLAGWGLRLLGRPAIAALAIGIAGSVGLGIVDLVIAAFLQLFLQRLGIVTAPMELPGPFRSLHLSGVGLGLGLLGIAFARSLGQYLVTRGGFVAFETMNAQLRRLAVYEMLLQPGRGFMPAAIVNARIGETFPKAAWCCFFGVPLIASVAQGAVLAAVMAADAWRESLIALAGVGVVGVVVLAINRRTRVVAAQMPKEQYALTEGIERVARNVLLIRVLRTQAEEHRRFSKSIATYEAYSLRGHALTAAASNLTPFFALVLLLGIILVSLRALHTPGLALLSFLYLFVRFAQNLAAAVQTFSQVNQFFPQLHESLSYVAQFSKAEVDAVLESGAVARVAAAAPTTKSAPIDTRLTPWARRSVCRA